MTRPLRFADVRSMPLLAATACAALGLAFQASAGTRSTSTSSTTSNTTSNTHATRSTKTSYRVDDGPARFAYVRVESDIHSTSGSGDMSDFDDAERLESQHGPKFLYLRRGGDRYVIEDQALLERSQDILDPMDILGRQQGFLGSKQGKLGASQARLGGEQAKLGREQALLGAEQSRLSSQLSRHAADGRVTGELERRIAAISEQQSALGERQGELGGEQARLGEQQAKLGHEQSMLGERQSKLYPEIVRGLMALLDDAIASGRAERVTP